MPIKSALSNLPGGDTAGVLMAQREMAFWNPFFFEFKRLACEAVGEA